MDHKQTALVAERPRASLLHAAAETESGTMAQAFVPDASMDVLGSPRIALWFEVVASGLLPAPTTKVTHVGVGIVVHHLARTRVGDRMTVEATVETVAGRRIVFSCVARYKSGVLALGTHQRMVLTR